MALVMTMLLPLAGCGSGEERPDVKPSGQAPAAQSADSSAKAEFPFPPDIELVFESPPPSDPTKAAIISGFEYVYRGYYYSLHTRGKDRRFFKRTEHEALFLLSKTFDGAIKNRLSVTGRLRFFNTRVPSVSGGRGAAVESCIDETQWRVKELRTGKTVPATRKKNRRRYKIIAAMRRGDDAVWRMFDFTTYYLPDTRAKECQQ